MITATPVALNKKDRKLLTGRLLEDKKSFYKLAIILCFDEICSLWTAAKKAASRLPSDSSLEKILASRTTPAHRRLSPRTRRGLGNQQFALAHVQQVRTLVVGNRRRLQADLAADLGH